MAHCALGEISDEDRRRMEAGGGLLTGPPVAAITLRVIDDRWDTRLGSLSTGQLEVLECATGVAGEIVVSGPHVLPGYLDGRYDEETKFRVDGTPWHRTGDAGYLDALGRLWLLGRCAARIDDAHGRI